MGLGELVPLSRENAAQSQLDPQLKRRAVLSEMERAALVESLARSEIAVLIGNETILGNVYDFAEAYLSKYTRTDRQ